MSRDLTQHPSLNALAAAVLLCGAASAQGRVSDARPEVDVYVPKVPSYWGWALLRSEAIASSIYAEIGIDLRFHAAKDFGHPSESLGGNRKILLAFWESSPPDFHPGAVAFARPYDAGSRLNIFLDRIQPMLDGAPMATGALLGHVLAHEIGHILQCISRHSEEGLMKARWSDKEVWSMPSHPLRFTPYDAELIYDALADRRGWRGGVASSSAKAGLFRNLTQGTFLERALSCSHELRVAGGKEL